MNFSKYLIKSFSMFLLCIHLPFAALIIAAVTFISRTFGFVAVIYKWTQLQNHTRQIEEEGDSMFEDQIMDFNSHLILMTDTNVILFGMLASVALGAAVWNQKSYLMLPYLYHEPIILLSYVLSMVEALVSGDYSVSGTFLIILCTYGSLSIKTTYN